MSDKKGQAVDKPKVIVKFEPLLDFEDISPACGLKVSFIKKAIREYGFPFYRIGRRVKFRASEVEVWIKQRKQAS